MRFRSMMELQHKEPVTDDEIREAVRLHSATMCDAEIAEMLQVPQKQVRRARVESGFTRIRGWSASNDDYVISHSKIMSIKEMAGALGKSEAVVRKRCRQLGVYRGTNEFTEEEDEYIMKNFSVRTDFDMAFNLKRHQYSVRRRRLELGCRRRNAAGLM